MAVNNTLYPLSLPQEAFYYDYLLNGNNSKYIMSGALILEGDLNIETYREAYDYVIQKYDAMRIKFIKQEELLFQQIRTEYHCEIKYFDFRGYSKPIEDALDFILKECRLPISMEDDDLYTEKIIQTADKQFIFAPKFHHMVNDAYGRAIINQTVADIYNNLIEKKGYPEIKPFSYVDFINDDLQYRNSDSYKKSFEYWKQKLANLPEPFDFTSKKKGIKNISLHTERITLNLHRICFDSILNIASESDATTFNVILGLVVTTLNKCYRRDEMVIGTPMLNRSNFKFRSTPGMFMTMMALRLKINPEGTFNDVLNTIKSETREGYRHQRFPIRDIVKHLRTTAPEFNNEIFDITVIYRKNDYSQKLGGAKLNSITFDTGIRSESLSIEIDEFSEDENVNLFFNYNPFVITEDEVVQFIHCFESILMDLVHFPEKTIKELRLLNDFDAHKILNEFNSSPEKIVTDKTIVELFEETAERWAGNDAVIFNQDKISYKELNQKANRIANYLLANYEIHSEDIICLASVRSIDAIAAMIGIMKTGAAYLPIDIDYPIDRIKYIIENSGSQILIKNGLEEKNLAEIEIDLSKITLHDKNNPGIKIKPDNLAYIIYTSGSTGKPKGVLIEHAQFTNMFVNMIGKFGVMEKDHVLQFASLGFDASVFEIFQALLTGAALVIADKEKIRNTELFVDYISENKVTIATLPPVYLNLLDKHNLPYLNTLATAGEAAIPSDVNFYKQYKRYINGYGPTETSVCASYYVADKNKEYSGMVPIGKPAPNLKIYILDEDFEPVPIGFPGELCVSGLSLARGYLKNEELTKQKFINNPFEKDTRLYRTGDLARWRQDGNLEFLGRIDNQVKINGNRIELGEIENHLAGYDNVKEVTVLDVKVEDKKELAAFIAARNEIDVSELKRYLRKFLPEFMIPLHYLFIEKLPVTQNGKINKEALRILPIKSSHKKKEYKAACNELESLLINIFEDVLDVKPVGIDDNFFELGGESLKIARLISRIHKELKREIGFKTIFDSPTVRSIAEELELKESTEFKEIPVAPIKEYYSLSHAQKRLWVLAQNKEDSAVYNMPISLLLKGKLNLDVLEKSLNIIILRHEVLHTIYVDINGMPFQKVSDNPNFTIEYLDLNGISDKNVAAKKIIRDKIIIPFDLAVDIPIRVSVIKLDKEENVLLIVLHHIAGDGLSIGVIMNELSLLYNSLIKGTEVYLKPLKIQYKDYCEYENELVRSEKYNEERRYWITKLKNPLPLLDLVYDRPRPPLKTHSGDFSFYKIEREVTQNLNDFCNKQNVSLFVVLTAIVNVLLHKYSSQEEIIIGSPVAGRNQLELEDQVGVYLNTVALRNQIKSSSSFIEFLNSVKLNSTEAISNSNYPFDHLVQVLNLERDTSHSVIFDVLVQLQAQDSTKLKLKGIESSFYEAEFKLTKFDLTFTFVQAEDVINFSIGYNTDLFNKERINRAAQHLKNIITYILKEPGRIIGEINLLDAPEKQILNNISTGKIIEFDREATIPGLFEEQVRKTPGNKALVFENKEFTYNELNERANAVANEIRKRTIVNPDDIIGIMTTRSELMIIGILGILKAGAAYLPIESDYPIDRISYMLKDSKAKLLLTESNLAGIAKEAVELNTSGSFEKTSVLCINNLADPNNSNPETNIRSSNLAYVIYTSGSTGKPKGVMIEHRSLHNLVLGLSNEIYKNNSVPLNIALIAPFVFDASVKQIFYALLNGHCLDIVPDEIKTNGRKLIEYYRLHNINVSDGTPIHLEIILDELEAENIPYLPERFLIGGQQLTYQTAKKFFELTRDGSPVITNVYGPTECCDVSTCFNINYNLFQKQDEIFNGLPVGKPLNNITVYILDSNLAQVPVGVKGELCIAGEGLARGYVNSPEMTTEKFIKADLDKDRMIYKTGDVGYFLEDGNIILTGRSDDQIKLRGYRIELNEIESCLRKHGNIKSAAVISTGEGNDQEIAAYYSAAGKIETEELKQYLSLHLPSYMIPSFLIELENLPLTINGKVDKKSLPLPVKETLDDINISSPGDILEEKLCEIWKELLHLDRVSPADNFFKLGGHSLIAIRLASRIHKELNIEINIWEVFQYPTVSSLAKLLKSKNPVLFNPIEKIQKSEYYPLSNSQRRLWVLAKLDGQNSLYNVPGAFLLKGDLNVSALQNAFKAIVMRHESCRTFFIEIDGEPFQKILDNVDFNVEISNYSGITWDENILKEIADDYFKYEFDLSKAPLLKIKLVKFSENNHLLLFNMHHIISDGWSFEVLIKEFAIYYNAFITNSEVTLQPLRVQYKDYAAWQNKNLAEKSLERVKEYWREKLKKPRPLLNLPADFKRNESFSIDGDLIKSSLDGVITQPLIELSTQHNASLFMTLLSTVYILLYKYTGEEDIMIGSPVAGRQHNDLENQIGFFINTIVLRNEINPESTFIEILNKVKKNLSEALDNQIYPFDKLVDELDVERIPNRNPFFDVMVAWMVKNGMNLKMNFDGLEFSGLDFRIAKSMFDLTFLFSENEGKIIYAIEYNTSLFRKERIVRMMDHFTKLIGSIISNPNERIKNLELIPEKEKEKLLSEFNSRNENKETGENVIQLFGKQAALNNNNIALVCDERKITYGELEKLSNKIANHIIENVPLKKDDVVAVIVENPILAVASVLGVMKTGAAYLPIMPDNPVDRIRFIINDSKAKAVLADLNLSLNSCTEDDLLKETVFININGELSNNQSSPENKIEAESLAYIIYTSGSTGLPKGVMIEHSSLTNLIMSLSVSVYSKYRNTINELMITSFAFDVSLKQIFAVLCNGKTLHILNKERRLDPREIIKYITGNKINIVDVTPSVFSVMQEEGFNEIAKPDLLEIFLGSEALPFKLVKEFYGNENNRKINVTNFYGPTECCVESSFFKFNPYMQDENYDIAPIGKPILNEQIYILDKYLNLCPVGIPGEICIAGKGLAREYLNDSEMTKKKFVNLQLLNGTRIYRTGDLGKILPDGNIEFLGRLDEQVKIRGYRIELQEIEKRILELTEINECAVILFEKSGTGELAAYYTSDGNVEQTIIRNHLERILPKYMVPSYFIQLENIPLSSSGKANKKLLPEPGEIKRKEKTREPETELESLILQIYSDVLRRDNISLEDNFFEIGGNSLNAVRVISRIQKELDIDLPLKEIFFNPVLVNITRKVEELLPEKDTFNAKNIEENIIVPMSDDELKLLSNLEFDDDEE